MAVSMRRAKKRRPIGTIVVLCLLALGLVWVFIPLVNGEAIKPPLQFLNQYLTKEVHAGEPTEVSTSVAEGKIRVFVSGREIPAYEKLTRDDLWNDSKGTWAHTDLDEGLVESGGVLVDVRDIVGRVLARKKSPSYAFTESDFLPMGTRPGVTAGVPAGKRAIRIEVESVRGIVGLQPGDRFDMMAAFPLDEGSGRSEISFVGVYADQMRQRAKQGAHMRARVHVLVQNGVVVTPLQTRLVPTTVSSLTQGATTRTKPVQEMVIALAPDEIAPFMEALSVEADITCLARSGRPDDPVHSVTPSSDPSLSIWGPSGAPGAALSTGEASELGSMTVIESINERGRELIPVPRQIGDEGDVR